MTLPVSARTLRGTPRNLAFLAQQLRHGELVAVPTETVYGLAANAFDADACRKIFAAKGRPATDPLIVHIYARKQLDQICQVNSSALRLAEAFWPGPLTLVLPKLPAVPDVVTAGKDSVAIRLPAHPVFRKLLRLAGVPLAAPSANPFGYVSPTTAEHVADGLGRRIKLILDGGSTEIGLESTIVDLRDERRPKLLRPGAITRGQLERVLHKRVAVIRRSASIRTTAAQDAPGMLKRHYSPRTPVTLHRKLKVTGSANEAFVFFRKPSQAYPSNVAWLDERGDLAAAGRRLFATLRNLDARGFRRIHIELAPGKGLADAINDRLRRAAAK